MLAGNYRRISYPHNSNFGYAACNPGITGCQTVIGNSVFTSGTCPSADQGCVTVPGFQLTQALNGLGQAYVPSFTAYENDVDARLGIKVANPHIYIGAAGLWKDYSYLGYPNINGVGFGLEKLPDLDQPFSLYGTVYYFPSVKGNYTYPTTTLLGSLSGSTIPFSYEILKYEVGGTVNFGKTGVFLDFGYGGERENMKENTPSAVSITHPYVGLGLHF